MSERSPSTTEPRAETCGDDCCADAQLPRAAIDREALPLLGECRLDFEGHVSSAIVIERLARTSTGSSETRST
jgi:hypothetical protein